MRCAAASVLPPAARFFVKKWRFLPVPFFFFGEGHKAELDKFSLDDYNKMTK
jgi:hypothetical protein